MSCRGMLITLLLIGVGCSDTTDKTTQPKAKQDHIWKGQTEVIERAKEVETTIMDAAKVRQNKTQHSN